MGQLEFDEQVSKRIEAAYAGRDMVHRRALVREALAAAPGERVLDVGCGPGFYVAELLEAVGPERFGGRDRQQRLDAGARRPALRGARERGLSRGRRDRAPGRGRGFDAALSVQVLEYVAEIPAALAELRRVLRPGGRLVIWDVDWATLSMRTAEPERMRRMLAAWDEHLTHVSLPQALSAELRAAGFADVVMDAYAFATTELSPDSYGGFLVPFLEQFVVDREAVAADEARAWADEQRGFAERGEFYSCVTQFRFTAAAPPS